ncbi:hypothetical protein [Paenibacillus sp. J22TS3]|nr:hypothetical protein [Paenibacillus sp. J22TS3]
MTLVTRGKYGELTFTEHNTPAVIAVPSDPVAEKIPRAGNTNAAPSGA